MEMRTEKGLMKRKEDMINGIILKRARSLSVVIILFLILAVLVLNSSTVSAYTQTNNFNALTGGIGSLAGGFFGETAGQFDRSMCQAGQDFVLQMTPAGCTPAVVRSDLLEEQNVPVYCQISATQINPLVDVKAIDWITFSGQTPPSVSGVSFFPNNAALGTGRETTLGTNPVLENIGYAVIVLKRQPNESAMPDYVEGNLTAKIRYNIQNAWGVGSASYYLPEMSDADFNDKYKQYGFWDGRGYLKADSINVDSATISVYSGKTTANSNDRQKMTSVTLQSGKTSGKIYMTGFNYCLANMQIKLDKITYPDTRAKIRVNADIYEVAEGEEFLAGKCKVTDVKKYGINEQVTIKCQEDENSGLFGGSAFTLRNSPKVKLEVNGVTGSYGLGDLVGTSTKKETLGQSVYVAYIGSVKNTNTIESLKVMLITVAESKNKLNDSTLEEISTRLGPLYEESTSANNVKAFMSNLFSKFAAGVYQLFRYTVRGENVDGLFQTDGVQDIQGIKIQIKDFAGPSDVKLDGQTDDYYQKSIADYNEVMKSFSSETYNGNNLGVDSFRKKISFVNLMQQKKTLSELCQEFSEAYPQETIPGECSNAVQLSNEESSSKSVTINGRTEVISFDGVYEPSKDEYSIDGSVKNLKTGIVSTFSLRNKEIEYVSEKTDSSAAEFFQLDGGIKDENTVELLTKVTPKSTQEAAQNLGGSRDVTFKKGTSQIVGNYEITITKINLKRVAQVSVLPNIDYSGTDTTFKFKVGIEKRNDLMKLSPQQAQDKINSLNESIKNIEKISSDMGTVVTGLKTACLATGAFFTIDNLLGNLNGEGMARQRVMRNSGGWYDKCKALVPGTYKTLQECLFENSDKIEADVDRYYTVLSNQNKEIEGMQKYTKEGGLFSESVVDTSALIKDYSRTVSTDLSNCAGTEFADPSGKQKSISISEITKDLSVGSNAGNINKNYNFEELRDIGFYCGVLQKNPNDLSAKTQLYSLLYSLKTNSQGLAEVADVAASLGLASEKVGFIEVGKNVKSVPYLGLIYNDVSKKVNIPGISADNPVEVRQTNIGTTYIVILDNSKKTSDLPIMKNADGKFMVYDEKTGVLVDNPPDELKGGLYFKKTDASSFNNEWKTPYVRYYETDPFKGYPAIVPVEPKNGWYAGLKQTLPVGSNIRTADASGKVFSYYLCNVGSNNEPNFFEDGFGDDICQMIVTGSQETYTYFSGLSATKVSSLMKQAAAVIESAQKKYSAGATSININGVGVKVESPAANIPEVECEDFMSPNQCKILFNVCDPVVCPSSRCNLGGAYNVQDVIQSGVIGSIALCLPNIREGIYIPVCLTGVKAGLDNWISIEKSYQSCLGEQLKTGKTIGICDEIQSIYACEFFWRQALPVAKITLPALTSAILGQNTRGGGEYMGVNDAFNRAEKSVDYFTQYYAEDSFKAFKARSTDEVGGEVCKSFVSAVYPSSGNILDTLTKPDSPPQFTGNFEEIPFTTATNPPTSQYKVFYHIYAGTDSGAYFRVYLKGSPGSSYYQDTAVSRVVDYGYVETGGYKSNTVDFTAPSGYSQLCILVNGQEECGFKQVSTDFSLNYIKDQYLSQQATANVTSESECISGSPNLYSLLNPNLQEGVSNVINPELYNSGIYRICATNNPGQGTDSAINTENQRWIDVGYCDNSKVRCWIDTQSVKNVIKNANTETNTLDEINKQMQQTLQTTAQQTLNFDETVKEIDTLEDKGKITKITDILGKFYLNVQKGALLILRGDAYGRLAQGLFDAANAKKTAVSNETASPAINQTINETSDVNATIAENILKEETLSQIVSYPKVQNDLLPARVRIITYRTFGDNFFGDLFSSDHIYAWNNVVWTYTNDGIVIKGDSVGESYKNGLEGIDARIKTENDAGRFSKAELQCGSKSIIFVTSYDLFSTNVIEKLDKVIRNNCANSSTEIPAIGTCSTQEECQKLLGNEIIKTAREIKQDKGISDTIVNQQTGAKNFECFVLQQAYQESKIQQCKEYKDSKNNPLYCNGSYVETLKSSGNEKSYGIMMININANPTAKANEFLENIKFGVNYLIQGYSTASKIFTCTNTQYSGWARALRNYNGWGCTGDNNYVENVINNKAAIEKLFPETCGTGTTLTTTSRTQSTTTTSSILCEIGLEQKGWWDDFVVGDFWFKYEDNSWLWKATNTPKSAPTDYKIISSLDATNGIFKDSRYKSYNEIIKNLPATDYSNGISYLVNYVNNVLQDEQLVIIKNGEKVYTTTGTDDFNKIKSLCGI